MDKKQPNRFLCALLLLVIATVACSTTAPAMPTPTVPPPTDTPSPIPSPTLTPKPTATRRPTSTPNVTATAIYDHLFSSVQMFTDEGFIPSTKGGYRVLEDFDEQMAQIGWLRYLYYDFLEKNFVFTADVSWQTAVDTTDTSGCGIVFGVVEKEKNNEYYGVVLDKSRIYFISAKSGYYSELGKSRGTGRLNFGNPAEAELTLLVVDNKAYVYVDDAFIGEYTLSESKELRGKFGYGIISGTNKDYGTKCRIANARLWELRP
jgi:hypothetical protein